MFVTDMTRPTQGIVKYLLRVLFALTLLVLAFHFIDTQQFSQMIGSIRWEFLCVLLVLVIVLFLLQAVKTKFILAQQGCDISVGRLFCLSAVTSLYNMIIPGVLSTGIKWYLLKRDTGKGAQAFSAMAYNQFSIMLVMMSFGLAALTLDNPLSALSEDKERAWALPLISGSLLAAILLVFVLLLNRRTGAAFVTVLARILALLPAKFRVKAESLLQQGATFQTAGYRFHLSALLLTVVVNLGGAVAVYCVAAHATNVVVPIRTLVWIAGVLYVLGRLPISIGNLGVREVTLVGLLPIYGVDKSAALLMSMTIFLAMIFRAILGALCQIFWRARPADDLRPAPNHLL